MGDVHSSRKVKYLEDGQQCDRVDGNNQLIAQLIDMEQATLGPDINISKVLDPVHNRGTNSSGDTIVI